MLISDVASVGARGSETWRDLIVPIMVLRMYYHMPKNIFHQGLPIPLALFSKPSARRL
jgi:hypothetical protein